MSALRSADGRIRFEQMRKFLELILACAEDVLEQMGEMERLAKLAEERTGPAGPLFVMPDRKDTVQ